MVKALVCLDVSFEHRIGFAKNEFYEIGATFANLHMLNSESRKYFKRVFLMSGSASDWWFRKGNHTKEIQECLQTKKSDNELVEHLKTLNASTLSNCNYLPWVTFIENPETPGAFISQTPDEIYKSDEAPIMDTMFGFGSQVCF